MVKSSTHEDVIACLVRLQETHGDPAGLAVWCPPDVLCHFTRLSKSVIHNSMHEHERNDLVIRRELPGQGQAAYEWALVDAVEMYGNLYLEETDSE